MKLLPTRKPSTKDKIVAGAIGGIASAGAYVAVQAVDIKAFDYPTDDFILLGRMVTDDESLMRPIGAAMHFGNGALLGIAYALIARDRLPGSPFVKGFTWTMMETFALYSTALLENLHPAIREGRLPSYLTGKGFTQQLIRHVGYGVVLGKATERVLRRL
jgi:hypothetical protein